jgi:hypothetical protein
VQTADKWIRQAPGRAIDLFPELFVGVAIPADNTTHVSDALPPSGSTVCCFPHQVRRAAAGLMRSVATGGERI